MLLSLRDAYLIGIDVDSRIVEDGCTTCGWGSLECTNIFFRFDNGRLLGLTREHSLSSGGLEVCVTFEEIVNAFTKVTSGYTWFDGTCEEFVQRMNREIAEGGGYF